MIAAIKVNDQQHLQLCLFICHFCIPCSLFWMIFFIVNKNVKWMLLCYRNNMCNNVINKQIETKCYCNNIYNVINPRPCHHCISPMFPVTLSFQGRQTLSNHYKKSFSNVKSRTDCRTLSVVLHVRLNFLSASFHGSGGNERSWYPSPTVFYF